MFLDSDALNIFTDASVSGEVTCGGAIAVYNNKIIDKQISVFNGTNNQGELFGIYNGVLLALKYRYNYRKINLFSDSQFGIYGLTKWMNNWYRKRIGNRLYSSSGKEVKNQEIFMMIVKTIVDNGLYINLYHQKGHVNDSDKSLQNAKSVFEKSNGISISIEEVGDLSYYNDYIDNFTRDQLSIIEPCNIGMPIVYVPKFNLQYYNKLIGEVVQIKNKNRRNV